MEDTGEAFRTSSWMRSCTPFVQEKGESNLLGESNIMHFNREFMTNLKMLDDIINSLISCLPGDGTQKQNESIFRCFFL